MLSLCFNLGHYSSFLPLNLLHWTGAVFNLFFSLPKKYHSINQWNNANPMYWLTCIFSIIISEKKPTALHSNKCRGAEFCLAVESWLGVLTVMAAHCSRLLAPHPCPLGHHDENLKCLAPIHCTEASVEHWLTIQDAVTCSLVTCYSL